jgi:ABC-type nitrate/sulfonate/bicarbonate transport system substrate-binding protein
MDRRLAGKRTSVVSSLIPYRVAMHVLTDSNIKSLADLKGKRTA